MQRERQLPTAAVEGKPAGQRVHRRCQQRPDKRDSDVPGKQLRPALGAAHGRGINMRPGSTQESQHRPQHEADGPDAAPLFQHGELPTPHEPKISRDELHRRGDRRNPAAGSVLIVRCCPRGKAWAAGGGFMKSYLSRLTQSSFPVLLFIWMVCCCGALGFGRCGLGPGITPTSRNMLNVFWAGPRRCTPFCEAIEQPKHLNWPPAYVSNVAEILQPSQSSPSSCWMLPYTFPPAICNQTSGVVGITFGIKNAVPTPNRFLSSAKASPYGDGDGVGGAVAWAKERCTTVEVWTPNNKNMETAPSTNDPNTGTYLRIYPPSGKAGNCTVWKYRKGAPKGKKPPPITRHEPSVVHS